MKKTYVSAMILAALIGTQCYAGGLKQLVQMLE